MPSAASLTGVMCRILLLTSVAYDDTNQITVEFSTPRFVAPRSMFFCFTTTSITITIDSIQVLRLTEGGTIFKTNETTHVAQSDDFTTSEFFAYGTGALDPLEVSTVYEVLGTDPYYGGSFKLQRYDDLIVDQQGISIRGLVEFPLDPASPPGGGPQMGNCFLLTGAWKANTRYQMTVQVTNPPPPAAVEVPFPPPPPQRSPPPSPHANTPAPPLPPSPNPPPGPQYMLYSNNATPILWVAPITYDTAVYGSGSAAVSELLFSVRGNKYGAACPLRPAIVPYMGTMFDACAESRKRGLGPEGNGTSQDCLRRLRSVAALPANKGTLPFTAPPLTAYNLSSFHVTSCPASSGQVLGPRLGGECISCGLYGVAEGGTCTCPSHVLPNLVGTVACGEPVTPDGAVNSTADLPAWLCRSFTAAQAQWEAKRLLDHNIAKQYISAFTLLASPVLDQAAVYAAFQKFNATFIFDDRRPNSPTRTYGIKPNCDKCTDGSFKDVYAKAMTAVFDWHFDAMNTLRFIGYVLDQKLGLPCPALWDSSDPKEWRYGYYNQIICKPMPEGTCCGGNFNGKAVSQTVGGR
ncbi:hypothetical protein Vretimale_4955 [Volvox reticuliferus]|uniref:Uncharacterized protein n=1 Tax=Volvox reticuliferus TaxID=1737510 RepID=A0A8J4C934_9CHLO|nr:hypothetical protein Vretifemale_4150 [Volvox reticuliferus]GIL99918.1 hypothetical protein Vretimale_4955 [Volvox reticuliferus]